MRSPISCVMVIIITSFCLTMPVLAKTDWQVRQKIQLEQAPTDMLVSANSKWIYILTSDGQILIYAARGQLKDSINVGPDVNQIKAGPRDDILFLLSREKKTVRVITIEFTEEIATRGSPAKGPSDAPVTVAVFSDFQ
ncbi:hypothetical protein D1BOALGB6SA_4018 [Olavius sp. associated proteobacterium Delta 1]|nr:hypothetical protein D1BOALGB6SA_4018 [Olavius sp. associated proteobacterium Delta 1]